MPSNCCVPFCVANGKSYILLYFYGFPSEKKKRETWKRLVRNDNLAQRPFVCSLHFAGGVKTYDNHTPTVFPWTAGWSDVVNQYNQRCISWFNSQTCLEHTYATPPKQLAITPIKHCSQTSKRNTATSRAASAPYHKPEVNVYFIYIFLKIYFSYKWYLISKKVETLVIPYIFVYLIYINRRHPMTALLTWISFRYL